MIISYRWSKRLHFFIRAYLFLMPAFFGVAITDSNVAGIILVIFLFVIGIFFYLWLEGYIDSFERVNLPDILHDILRFFLIINFTLQKIGFYRASVWVPEKHGFVARVRRKNKIYKILVPFNFEQAHDSRLKFEVGKGTVGKAIEIGIIAHSNNPRGQHGIAKEQINKLWPDLRAIIAAPTASSQVGPIIGAVAIDSSLEYMESGFDVPAVRENLTLLANLIGKFLDKYYY